MATGQTLKKTWKSSIFLVLVLLAAVLAMLLGYQGSKARSYAKIYPYAVDISISAEADAALSVQYDYGYGYLPEHLQIVELKAGDDVQRIALSISAWKTLGKLRLWSTQSDQLTLHSINLHQLGQVLNTIPANAAALDPNVLIELSLYPEQGAL